MPKFLDEITPTIECSITKWHSWTSSSGSFDVVYGASGPPAEYYFYFPNLYNRYGTAISSSACYGKGVFTPLGSSGISLVKEELLFSNGSIERPSFTITRHGSSSYAVSMSGLYQGETCGSREVIISYLKVSSSVMNSKYG